MTLVIYKDKKKEWRWKLKAKNGRVIAVSSEGYKRKSSAINSIQLLSNFFFDIYYNMNISNEGYDE